MDVTQLLEQDHRKVEELFTTYDEGQDEGVLATICDELEVHTAIEEELVYPRLAQLDSELEQHAEQEHAEAKQLIAQIRAKDPDAAVLAKQLEQAVQEHIREEEGTAFPLLRDKIGGELGQLGEQAARRKQQLTKQ
jgi:hemerythrin superfamily protein